MKSRIAAGFLALLFGVFGLQRLYVGDYGTGTGIFIGFIFSAIMLLFGVGSWSMFVLWVFGIADAINFFTMTDQAFHDRWDYKKIAH